MYVILQSVWGVDVVSVDVQTVGGSLQMNEIDSLGACALSTSLSSLTGLQELE